MYNINGNVNDVNVKVGNDGNVNDNNGNNGNNANDVNNIKASYKLAIGLFYNNFYDLHLIYL